MASSAPRYAEDPALASLPNARRREGLETAFDVDREQLVDAMRILRDRFE